MTSDFLQFLFRKVYSSVFNPIELQAEIETAATATCRDFALSNSGMSKEEVHLLVTRNHSALAVYLYRLGRAIYMKHPESSAWKEVDWLMRELCSMEIYFSVDIGEGFEVRHGVGSVIGSRCSIGKNFILHQGCTIGHRHKHGDGPIIGDYVELGANCTILGKIKVGNNVIIGANAVVLHDVQDGSKIIGVF